MEPSTALNASIDTELRRCTRCCVTKQTCDFGKSKGRPVSWCRECQNDYARKYYVRNKDRAKSYMRKYYESNRERVLERSKQYYYQHRDARLNYARSRNKRTSQPSHAN